MIIDEELKEQINAMNSLMESAESFKALAETLMKDSDNDEDFKDAEEVKKSIQDEIDSFNDDIFEEDLKNKIEFEGIIKQLNENLLADKFTAEQKRLIKFSIDAVTSSYTLDRLFDRKTNITTKRINQRIMTLRKNAETKLDADKLTKYYSSINIAKYIELVMTEKNKNKGRLVAGHIYNFIIQNKLAKSEYADNIFIFFLIRNIRSLKTDKYGIRNQLIVQLNKFAESL